MPKSMNPNPKVKPQYKDIVSYYVSGEATFKIDEDLNPAAKDLYRVFSIEDDEDADNESKRFSTFEKALDHFAFLVIDRILKNEAFDIKEVALFTAELVPYVTVLGLFHDAPSGSGWQVWQFDCTPTKNVSGPIDISRCVDEAGARFVCAIKSNGHKLTQETAPEIQMQYDQVNNLNFFYLAKEDINDRVYVDLRCYPTQPEGTQHYVSIICDGAIQDDESQVVLPNVDEAKKYFTAVVSKMREAQEAIVAEPEVDRSTLEDYLREIRFNSRKTRAAALETLAVSLYESWARTRERVLANVQPDFASLEDKVQNQWRKFAMGHTELADAAIERSGYAQVEQSDTSRP